MGKRVRGAAVLLLAWLLLTASAAAPLPAIATVNPASDEITLRCGLFRTVDVPVDWYVPQSPPHALVYVQHGFLGTKRQMRDLALAFAQQGYLVMVPTLSSFSPTCGVRSASLLQDLAKSGTDGRLRDSLRRATGTVSSLPRVVIVAGHSIGAAAVTYVASQNEVNGVVRLIIHLDAVETPNGLLATALQRGAGDETHTDAPILQITAPPSPLNANNSGPQVVGEFRAGGSYAAGIDGAVVLTGTHCDPLGNYPFNICGSTPENQRAFFDLAVAGANDVLDRTGTETFDQAVERLHHLVALTPHLMSA